MALIGGQSIEKLQNRLNEISGPLSDAQDKHDEALDELKKYDDPRWIWSIETILADEMLRIAAERMTVPVEDTKAHCGRVGQYEGIGKLIGRADELRAQAEQAGEELKNLREEFDKLAKEIELKTGKNK